MNKVVKFGGSSLASAKQFKKVKDIIMADKSRRYVIPSAPGKRTTNDEKVTDLLYACYSAASEGRSYKKIFDAITARYEQIITGLDLNVNLDFEFKTIEENFLAKKGRDYAASRGEYLNGIIMAAYLGYEFIDAADVICFDADGSFREDKPGACSPPFQGFKGRYPRLLRLHAGRLRENLLQRRFRYHRLSGSQSRSRRPVRELDRRVRFPGSGSQNCG